MQLVETLSERLWGLTEMFPERVRKATNTTVAATKTGLCQAYGLSRNVAWIVFSTSIILFAPVIFEVERANMEEMQRNQQKQVISAGCPPWDSTDVFGLLQMLLGPNSAISGGVPPPLLPPVQR